MTPQRRGIIPGPDLDRLLRAQQLVADARQLLEIATFKALEAGGSIQEVCDATGMSSTTVQKYGHRHGWPSPTRRRTLDADRSATGEFAGRIAAAEQMLRELGQP